VQAFAAVIEDALLDAAPELLEAALEALEAALATELLLAALLVALLAGLPLLLLPPPQAPSSARVRAVSARAPGAAPIFLFLIPWFS
jgi:hypothetical protein